MMDLLTCLLLLIYAINAFLVMLYGLNCYVMLYLYFKRRKAAFAFIASEMKNWDDHNSKRSFPMVTTQIPVFNEINVIERVMRAACRMRYPEKKHEIQILDDSTDETALLVDRLQSELLEKGHLVSVIRRKERKGFKAGALKAGMEKAKGELMAIFDADFVPPEDFLERTVPFFMTDEKLSLVQARWGHLNPGRSYLTKAQCLGIDGHFMIEQAARNFSGLYMNFNGTAGILRKTAIEDGGGWQADTLTEDMDLSYRMQLKGWKTLYLKDLVVPAEIPEDVSAFKSQQFRWAKGSIQTAIKLLPAIFSSPVSVFKKIEAFFHLTHYMVHPLMVGLSVMALPVIYLSNNLIPTAFYPMLLFFLTLSVSAPSMLYIVSQRLNYTNWKKRILCLPFLMMVGIGIALSNARGVFEALIGYSSDFIRTPKRGDRMLKVYRTHLPVSGFLEILLGSYCVISLFAYIMEGNYFIGPFLALYALGFLFVGVLTLSSVPGTP